MADDQEPQLASQILMDEVDDSHNNLPMKQQKQFAKGNPNQYKQGNRSNNGSYNDGRQNYGQQQFNGDKQNRKGQRQYNNQYQGANGWNGPQGNGYRGKNNMQYNGQMPQEGHLQYNQTNPNNQQMAFNMQQPLNPWAMQQAAASAMMSMGKDPMNPSHWIQMAQGDNWQAPNNGQQQQQQGSKGGNNKGGKNMYQPNHRRHQGSGNNARRNQQNGFQNKTSNQMNTTYGSTRRTNGHHTSGNSASNREKKNKILEYESQEEAPLSPNCSPLLQEFRSKNKKLELNDIRHNFLEFASDQVGSRFIQQKIETATEEEINAVESILIQEFQVLAVDVFGNYVIQKIFEHGTESQVKNLADQLVGNVLQLSLHAYGCRVIQKVLDCAHVDVETTALLMGELKAHVIQLIEDQNGNHVIQKCIDRMPPEKIQFILVALKGSVQRMATHCFGCRVIQRLIEHCTPPHQLAPLIDEIVVHIPALAQNQFGNYVIQHLLEHGRSNDRRLIIEVVRTQILMLSCHKFASNVVEKTMLSTTPKESAAIVHAIVGDAGDVNPALFTMMRDRYGNYIVQRLLEITTGDQRAALTSRLKNQIHVLKKFTYGKHIVQVLQQQDEDLADEAEEDKEDEAFEENL